MSTETDRELLKLAAKAFGEDIVRWPENKHEEGKGVLIDCDGWAPSEWWNPLADNGDALRLAVKLRMLIGTPGKHGRQASAQVVGVVLAQDQNQDPCTATRRSIVLAAAGIGKAMK